jgi:hypothetical protein
MSWEVMVDLEYMGAAPDAAIVSIGAVAFDLQHGRLGEKFYRVVDLQSALDAGGGVRGGTVMWWLRQSEAARAALAAEPVPLVQALVQFDTFMESLGVPHDERRVWGNGAATDNVILSSAYDRLRWPRPWPYRGDCCYRTIKLLHPDVPLRPVGTAHHALDDAEAQAQHLLDMLHIP